MGSFSVLPFFEDHRIEQPVDPPNRDRLFRVVEDSIQVVRAVEQLLGFLEPDSALLSQSPALGFIELEAHRV